MIETKIAKKVAKEIGIIEEKYSKTSYRQKAKVWEKYGKRRLYVPRNAFEQAGYIDLDTEEIHETRPGNYNHVKRAFDLCRDFARKR